MPWPRGRKLSLEQKEKIRASVNSTKHMRQPRPTKAQWRSRLVYEPESIRKRRFGLRKKQPKAQGTVKEQGTGITRVNGIVFLGKPPIRSAATRQTGMSRFQELPHVERSREFV